MYTSNVLTAMRGWPKFWVIISPCSVTRKWPLTVPLGCAMIACSSGRYEGKCSKYPLLMRSVLVLVLGRHGRIGEG